MAIIAAAIGGGTASLVEHYVGNDSSTVSSGVSGTNASNNTNGTVSGVAKAVMPSIVEINATSGSGESTVAGCESSRADGPDHHQQPLSSRARPSIKG
ncbi:hypothetical protein Sviol_82040 [Streptomyces violascens]|uniref:Chaplin domain-containing protein n=1 Tax=Streptomyces violascens TaxID=67381 RepID=A0ABQ3R2P6_9ACTN|nr:hypothetical protein Sviol_82040 [Streptomyces violascens]